MKITLHETTVGEVYQGYINDDEEGVYALNGKLSIRPKYQREFVYDDAKRNAVIDTITKGFPLNVMYWVKTDGGYYEVLDGQQRTISFCEYLDGNFTVDYRGFHNLTADEQKQILDYPLTIYICEGKDSEKLDWFRTINIAGEKLTDQELRNAVYAGEWLTDAKRYFSKTNCVAYRKGKDYLTGSPIRQDYLQTVLKWISNNNIEEYMARHQHDGNAGVEWAYYQRVIDWVRATFPNYRREMKGLDWGGLYAAHKDEVLNPTELEQRIKDLMIDDDITNKKGIYAYVLDGDERHLNIRAFTDKMKREAYERQDGVCPSCGGHFSIEQMEGDHITPWSEGGATTADNCQMLCRDCNRRKGGK
ncbi:MULTISPECIES: DUF262 domain-containing protein [unclassified Adlercreutzia]|uniref:GmrSD restriction endonuclease domain-containing protein n=1 Tax=unclassified Adlercreutzia TaxID=2636013 RepID=UPI0013E9A69D|nr:MULTISPECIES: DUF262 domain-containing protein [unclassified Adlercreutzia]